jgi:peptide/nickel transport system substrate-binding protein
MVVAALSSEPRQLRPNPPAARRIRKIGVSAVLLVLSASAHAAAFHEAPMLAERVSQGTLPPVEQRLPEKPVIVEPVESIGTYGGTWRRVALNKFDILMNVRLGYEFLVRWDRTGTKVLPGVAESWDIRDGGRTYVFHLRKGLKWSDGQPFSSEDILFWYQDVLLNRDVTRSVLPWLVVDRQVVKVTAPDPHTVEFRFVRPYGIFLGACAVQGFPMLTAKHYLKQFHPRYTDEATLTRRVRARGFDHWSQHFLFVNNADENPDLPTLKPFVLKVPLPASRVIAERNPYYWKVDPAGNQLPYIDRIAYAVVQNVEIANFKAMTGDVDFQFRLIDSANYSLFMQNRAKGGYQVRVDESPVPTTIYVNPYSKEERIRPILADRRFRIALSVALDRDEIIRLIYFGMADRSAGIVSPCDPYYLPEFDRKYTRYDPALANRLLDEVGLKRGADGMRRLPDGSPFRELLHCYPSEEGVNADLWQLIADQWREVGLDFVVKLDARNLSSMQAYNGNTNFFAYSTAGMHWIYDPHYYVPLNLFSLFAPLYGRYQASGGKDPVSVRPTEEYQRLIDRYYELRSIVDNEPRRYELAQGILRQWCDECYVIGVVRRKMLTIVSNRFRNVPERIINDNRLCSPGYIGIEQFYLAQE